MNELPVALVCVEMEFDEKPVSRLQLDKMSLRSVTINEMDIFVNGNTATLKMENRNGQRLNYYYSGNGTLLQIGC